jgi:hypothetical protein
VNPGPRVVLLTVWATFVVGTLVLNLLWPLPGQQDAWPWVTGLMAFPVAAVLVLSRRPTNGVGLALGAVGTAAAVIFVLTWYAVTFADAPQTRFAEALAGSGYVVQFAGLVALLHLFPTGRPMNGWHAGLFTVFAWLAVGLAALMPMRPGPLDVTVRPNPLGVPWLAVVVDDVGFGLLVVFALVGLGSLVARWRRAGPVERNQLKWFLAGAAAVVVLLLLLLTGVLRGNRYLEVAGAVFAVLAFWSLPAAMVVAITRYRLWDIDRIISRTLSYAVLVGVLGVVYVAGVLGLGSLLPPGRAGGRRLHPAGGRTVHPTAPAGPGAGGPPFQPPPLRRRTAAAAVRRPAAGRTRPRRPRRSSLRGGGPHAPARARHPVATSPGARRGFDTTSTDQ